MHRRLVRGAVGAVTDAREVLADVAGIGPAFAVSVEPAEEIDGAWRPVADLITDTAMLTAHVLRTKVLLGTGEDRVAASWLYATLAARLVAPVLAAAALHDVFVHPYDLRWRPWGGGVVPLWAPDPRGRPADVEAVHSAVAEPLGVLAGSLRAGTRVAAGLLRGEAAATVAKAARAVARERPDHGPAAAAVAAAVLAREPLTGGVRVDGVGDPIARRSCCLAYRVPGGHTCADCVLGPSRDGRTILDARHG
jgi:FhuF 2Fe-2S C-terminal domain